jgi:hypothetical protein
LSRGEQKVLAKLSFVTCCLQIGVRCRDYSDVNLLAARRTYPFHFSRFDHAQELCLLAERDIADLVQENCPAVRQLKASNAIRPSIRESALPMSE